MYHSFLIHSSVALCLFKVQLVFGLRLNNLEGIQPRPSKENQIKDLLTILVQFSSVQSLGRVQLFATPWIAGRQASLSITNSQVHPNLCASRQWCHPAISSSVIPSPPAPNPSQHQCLFQWSILPMRWPSIGVSALASVLPMNTQDWSPLEWTSWFSLQSKRLSGVFSNTTVQRHQFFGSQLYS